MKSVSVLFILICYTPGKVGTSVFLLSFHSEESQPYNLAHSTWLEQHRSTGSLHHSFTLQCVRTVGAHFCTWHPPATFCYFLSLSKWDFQKCKYLNPTSRSHNVWQFSVPWFPALEIVSFPYFFFFFFWGGGSYVVLLNPAKWGELDSLWAKGMWLWWVVLLPKGVSG